MQIMPLYQVSLVWAAIKKWFGEVEPDCDTYEKRAVFEDAFIDTKKKIFTNRNILAVGLFCELTTEKAVPLKLCSFIIKAADSCFQNLI